jgi:hypothetical protein
MIGSSFSTGGGSQSVIIGSGATTTTSNGGCVVIGGFSPTATNQGTAVGGGSQALLQESTAYGWNALAQGIGSCAIGPTTTASNTYDIAIGLQCTSNGPNAIAIGFNLTNNTPHSTIIGDNLHLNIRAANTTTDLGTSSVPFQSLYLNGNVAGPVNSRAVDNIVSNTSVGTFGNLCSFVSDKVIQDSGIALTSVGNVSGPGSSTNGAVVSWNGTTGKLIQSTTINAVNLVTDSGTASAGAIATYTGNKVIHDSGTLLSALLTSATAASTYLALSGGNMTGPVDSASALNLGTVNATSVNIGKVGIITQINGSAPSLGKFSTFASTALTGVTTVQNMLSASASGSLVYAANTTVAGTAIRYRIWGLITNSSINTATIVINNNGSSLVTLVWSPGAVTNGVFIITGVLNILTSNAVIDINAEINPVSNNLSGNKNASLPTWDKTIQNTLSATVQFGSATTTGTIYHAMFETMFD